MKILSWRSNSSNKPVTVNTHKWIRYSNPRNKKVTLQACAHCGILKNPLSDKAACARAANRATNMLNEKGWTEFQSAS